MQQKQRVSVACKGRLGQGRFNECMHTSIARSRWSNAARILRVSPSLAAVAISASSWAFSGLRKHNGNVSS